MFGVDSNKSKIDSRTDDIREMVATIQFRIFLLSRPLSEKKDMNIQNCNFNFSFDVWNLACHTKGRPYTEDVWGQGAEVNIWT
jgi:hypothetical protein